MRVNAKIYISLILPVFILLFFSGFGLCADVFDLSYTIVSEGGLRLELNQANPYKGIEVSVSSNVSTRYEVVLRTLSSLQDRANPRVTIRDNFVLRGLRGTNRYGNFRVPTTDSSVRQEQVLYVSDASGNSDGFTIVFGVDKIDEVEPGNYFGRLGLVLRPIDSVRSQVLKVIDVYVTINREDVSPKVEISLPAGASRIYLNPKKDNAKESNVLVKINGKFRKPFTIMQSLGNPPESETGERLDYRAVKFIVLEAKKGVAVNRETPVLAGLQNIYSSKPDGDSDEYFVVSYRLGDISGKKAGRYRSKIQYLLEGIGMQSRLEALEFEIENEPVFDFTITPGEQRYQIEFRNVKPTEPPRVSEVTIEISTNLGKRYQVNQEVISELTSAKGQVIPSKYFTCLTESLDTKGKLMLTAEEEVKRGSRVLFVSDGRGSPDKFKVIYKLSPSEDIMAGDYSTRITYTLLEI